MKTYRCWIFGLVAILFIGCEKDDSYSSKVKSVVSSDILPYSVKIQTKLDMPSVSESVKERGVCWSTLENPSYPQASKTYLLDQSGENEFVSTITTLRANTQYFIRAFAVTESGTVYGNQIQVTTPDYLLFNAGVKYGSVTDNDGNIYKTVTIGEQTWMAENLKTTHFQNGEPIPNITNSTEWNLNYTRPAYMWYGNEKSDSIYGAYYNWIAASDERNIAPKGWRVPTKADWKKLLDYTKHNSIVLRESSTAHWYVEGYYPGSNDTGFTLVSTGIAMGDYSSGLNMNWTILWTREGDVNAAKAFGALIQLRDADFIEVQTNHGYPIRCVKE